MAKIIDKTREKINSNPTLYIFIIFSELTYLMVFLGILFGFSPSKSCSILGSVLLISGIPFFLLVHAGYTISSFVHRIKGLRKVTVMLFFLRLFFIFILLCIFGHTK